MNKLIIFLACYVPLYLIWIQIKYGSLPSISESYYELIKEKRSYGVIFTFFLWGVSMPLLLIAGIIDSSWFFISGTGFAFVGVASAFKSKKMTEIIHNVGAITGYISALIGLLVTYGMIAPLMTAVSGTFLIILAGLKDKIYWIEVFGFLSIMTGLVFTNFL